MLSEGAQKTIVRQLALGQRCPLYPRKRSKKRTSRSRGVSELGNMAFDFGSSTFCMSSSNGLEFPLKLFLHFLRVVAWIAAAPAIVNSCRLYCEENSKKLRRCHLNGGPYSRFPTGMSAKCQKHTPGLSGGIFTRMRRPTKAVLLALVEQLRVAGCGCAICVRFVLVKKDMQRHDAYPKSKSSPDDVFSARTGARDPWHRARCVARDEERSGLLII